MTPARPEVLDDSKIVGRIMLSMESYIFHNNLLFIIQSGLNDIMHICTCTAGPSMESIVYLH